MTTKPKASKDKRDALPHPIQPVAEDAHGIVRFKQNAIVVHLLEHGGIDLNTIARLPFSDEDREQFTQLIGYSIANAPHQRPDIAAAAECMAETRVTAEQARIATLQYELDALRDAMRGPIARLYGIHPTALDA